ncbi:MAG: hypothetical protein KC417_12070 [Myxococcales bacterium]|nr:hypothetical protein [Myxococcales bacterium]
MTRDDSQGLRPRQQEWYAALTCALLLAACGGAANPNETTTPDDTDADSSSSATSGKNATAAPAGAERGPSAPERFALEKLFRAAATVRELPFKKPVPVEVHDRKAIEGYVQREIQKEGLEKDRLLYVTLGLLPADMDIESMLVGVLGEQIVGYYDTTRAQFVVRDDVMRSLESDKRSSFGEADIVIVHEMVHALQDQHLALTDHHEDNLDTDASNAYHAVVEGDATLAMLGYLAKRMGANIELFTKNSTVLDTIMAQASAMPGQEELGQAPAIVRIPLMWSYFSGLKFCAVGYDRSGWRGVDTLHTHAPASTEQVIHPEKYAANETPVAIELPALTDLEHSGLVKVKDDTLGELEISIFFGAPDRDQDTVAAAGWGGDRLRLYRRADGAGAFVWWMRWDTDADAKEAEAAARRTLATAKIEGATVLRLGKDLWLTRGLTPAQAKASETEFRRRSRSR